MISCFFIAAHSSSSSFNEKIFFVLFKFKTVIKFLFHHLSELMLTKRNVILEGLSDVQDVHFLSNEILKSR